MNSNSTGLVVEPTRRTRRWATRAIGLSFISLPFLLLLVWGVLAYLARYGADTVWNTVPALDWSDEALVRALANRNLPRGHLAVSILTRRSPKVIQLVVPLLDSQDPLTRNQALQVIGARGPDSLSVLPLVLAHVDDSNAQVAGVAMWAAVEIAPADKRVQARIHKATQSSDVRISRAAIFVVGRLKPVPMALVVRLMRHPDLQTAGGASDVFQKHSTDRPEPLAVVSELDQWLESLSTPDRGRLLLVIDAYRTAAANVLRGTARNHPKTAMRLFALEELAPVSDQSFDEFIPELRRLAESDEPENDRRAAIHLLARIGRTGQAVLRELSKSSDEYTRFQSTVTLAGVERTPVPTEELLSWFITTKDKRVRRDCISMLSIRPRDAAKVIERLEPLRSDPALGDDVKAAINRIRYAAATSSGEPPE